MGSQMKKEKQESKIRVVLFPESAGKHSAWVAQCLDYDLVAQGETPEAAQASFQRIMLSHVAISLQHKHTPFLSIAKIEAEKPKAKTKTELSPARFLKGLQVAYSRLSHPESVPAV